jgi:protein farnesyltransferase subunit beta
LKRFLFCFLLFFLLQHWSASRQMRLEGGFAGRTNKLVDGCYSFWVGGLFPLLDMSLAAEGRFPYASNAASSASAASASAPAAAADAVAGTAQIANGVEATTCRGRANGAWLYDPMALQRYLLICCQDSQGGLVDKPPKCVLSILGLFSHHTFCVIHCQWRRIMVLIIFPLSCAPHRSPDYYHTAYCLSGLATAQHATADARDTSQLLGSAQLKLRSTHPVYNIEDTKAGAALAYFGALPNPSDPSF